MTERPNILLFITDQQRADYLGCAGHPVLRTPNIDRLAEQGTLFERFLVASPVCMPNRASLMTGRMPSCHGVRHNGVALSLDETTFVEVLRADGYRTALIGKSHLQNFSDRPASLRFRAAEGKRPPSRTDARPLRDGPAYAQEAPESWTDATHRVSTPFYGFEHVDLCTGHGDDIGGDYRRWLAERVGDPDAIIGQQNALPDPEITAPQTWRSRVAADSWSTAYIGECTRAFLDDVAQNDAPFFAQVSFPDPHHPFTAPTPWFDAYDPRDMVLPESFGKGTHPVLEHMRKVLRDGTAERNHQRPFAVTEDEARQIIAVTCGMIAFIDETIGQIMHHLQERGLERDTVVIFTSDHGDFMGEYGVMLKFQLHNQSVTRVPFILYDPRNPGGGARRHDLAGAIDIAPTILGLAGIAPFNGVQGRNLLAPDALEPAGWLIEEEMQSPMMGLPEMPRLRTLVTQDWRLTIRGGGTDHELYNLRDDPGELQNLLADPAHAAVRAELTELMVQRMIALCERSPLPTRLA